MKSGYLHKSSQVRILQPKSRGGILQLQDNRDVAQRLTDMVGIIQLKNSRQPNWFYQYSQNANIHGINVGNYVLHVEQGGGAAAAPTGFHALSAAGAPPAHINIVQQANVGYNSIGKVLWYNTNLPNGNGFPANPIPVKSSTVFPLRLSNIYNGITGVRALMKAAIAGGDAWNAIREGTGLGNLIHHAAPTVFPVAPPLRPQGQQFIVGGINYRVM